MRLNLTLTVIVVTLVGIRLPAEGKRVTLIPLSSTEVYRLLREIGREDAVPEGRVVTQGIAAVSGFAVGLAKGIGGSLLLDMATNLWTNQNQNQNQTMEAQEICFNSRSLNEINDVEDAEEEDDAPLGRQSDIIESTGGTGADDYNIYSNDENVDYNDGDISDTRSFTSTQTGTGGAVNCVVIQKPTVNG